jgi:hypothetical protein
MKWRKVWTFCGIHTKILSWSCSSFGWSWKTETLFSSELFELLIFKSIYEDLRSLISVSQNRFMRRRSTVSNLIEYTSFILRAIEDVLQVNFVYTLKIAASLIEPTELCFKWASRQPFKPTLLHLVHERHLSNFQIRSSSFLCRWHDIVSLCELFARWYSMALDGAMKLSCHLTSTKAKSCRSLDLCHLFDSHRRLALRLFNEVFHSPTWSRL